MKGYVEKLASYKGKLSDEESFVEYLIISRDFEEALGRTYQYASLKSDLNKKDINALTNLNNCHMILYTYSEACSFQDPEILAMGKEKVMDIIDRHPEIEEFRFMCVKLFDQNAHVLDAKSEELLSIAYSDYLNDACEEILFVDQEKNIHQADFNQIYGVRILDQEKLAKLRQVKHSMGRKTFVIKEKLNW